MERLFQTYKITDVTRIEGLRLLRDKRVCIVHDDDADGVCSAVITWHALDVLGARVLNVVPKSDPAIFTKPFYQHIDAVVCLDFNPISWNMIETPKIPVELIVIDHHKDTTLLFDKYDTLYLHPFNCSNSKDAGQYCTTKFGYDIWSKLVNISQYEWKCLPGMIGDMNIIKWPEFIKQKAEKFGHPITGTFFDSVWGRIADVVLFARSAGVQNTIDITKALYITTKASEMLTYESEYASVKAYVVGLRENYAQYAHEKKGVVIVHMPDAYEVASGVSSTVSYLHPTKTFLFIIKSGKYYYISARSQQSKVHLGEIIEAIVKKYPGAKGGGHKPAAGAFVPEEYIEKFIDDFVATQS